MCMRVEFHHTKNGLPSLCALSMNASAAGGDLLVDRLHALLGQRAGVLDLAAVALALWITPRGPNFFLNSGSFG